jgi:hypothetical protein
MIPGVGEAAKAGKLAVKVGEDVVKAVDDGTKIAKDIDKGAHDAETLAKTSEKDISHLPYSKSRPKYAPDQAQRVYDNAKSEDGKVYDPHTQEELPWDKSKPRNGQWDMGHMPGKEYRKLRQRFESGEISKAEFLKEYRDPANYRPESVHENRSRKWEVP